MERYKTWQILIAHSIVMTIYYGFFIPFQGITYFIPFLAQYTGSWICYTASFLSFYCFHAMISHTLIVSILKYVFIVRTAKTHQFGEHRVQKCFFWINLVLPLLLTTIALSTSDWDTRSYLKSCIGKTEHVPQEKNSSSASIGKFFFCSSANTKESQYIPFSLTLLFCNLRKIVNWIIVSNLVEGMLYYRIFHHMKR